MKTVSIIGRRISFNFFARDFGIPIPCIDMVLTIMIIDRACTVDGNC